jgi:hypothetical protein
MLASTCKIPAMHTVADLTMQAVDQQDAKITGIVIEFARSRCSHMFEDKSPLLCGLNSLI